jgi:hypothetical protein
MCCSFSAAVPLRALFQKALLNFATVGGRILSTPSLTPFDVRLSMIVLCAAHVLIQSSAGMAARAAANRSASSRAISISYSKNSFFVFLFGRRPFMVSHTQDHDFNSLLGSQVVKITRQ